MHNHTIFREGDTIFITKNGEVKHYYATIAHEVNNETQFGVAVFEHNNDTGYKILSQDDIEVIINKSSELYNECIKNFLEYIATNLLPVDKDLYLFIVNVWNEDNDKINPVVLDNPGVYEEKAEDYLKEVYYQNYGSNISLGAILIDDLRDESFFRPRFDEAYKEHYRLP